ncbi:MAG: GTPase Der [Acidimicrobiales bacterium]|nr:MAG: ribosome biogenesis GTPase Der [Actinomycetota bacterium]MBV6507155.1 GTPase Der [Acidimicrobiales bacterium]RIK05550.1 MAG: ribosome biogenesis GTPase Der [Acidobacteriota bacterium]
MGPPLVAIVGRPNVGKSTLLNRIVGRLEAIVEEKPGVTRDRKVVDAEWQGHRFSVVDTGGWLPRGSTLDEQVSRQSELAMREADAVVFVVDTTVGVTDEDARIADLLRRSPTPVVLVANKVDDPAREPLVWELLSLGLGDPWPVSALHGRRTGDLLDHLVGVLPEQDDTEVAADASGEPERVFSVAILGRPNVGKSTLFNRLIGDDRVVVHDLPGTTRDSIDTIVETGEGPIRFIDTAGMRRRAKIGKGAEYYSLVRALRAVDDADVALLVVDSSIGVTHQDQRLAERIDIAGCPIVVVLNKWDLLDQEGQDRVLAELGRRLHFIGESTVLRMSALSGRGVQRLVPALATAIDEYQRRVPTRRVNEVIRRAQQAQPAPHGGRVLYATQGATDPPTFTLFANRTLPPTYLRYLERSLRQALDLGSTPVKLRVRRRSE